jgi:hypothetical protein
LLPFIVVQIAICVSIRRRKDDIIGEKIGYDNDEKEYCAN